mmetsp:Transcript_15314/g.47831  ORF Transcript_15314/g.47831 Transcript_15314/m.47831 type:complete len:277 (-) Transcript_15314:441-1271(-)
MAVLAMPTLASSPQIVQILVEQAQTKRRTKDRASSCSSLQFSLSSAASYSQAGFSSIDRSGVPVAQQVAHQRPSRTGGHTRPAAPAKIVDLGQCLVGDRESWLRHHRHRPTSDTTTTSTRRTATSCPAMHRVRLRKCQYTRRLTLLDAGGTVRRSGRRIDHLLCPPRVPRRNLTQSWQRLRVAQTVQRQAAVTETQRTTVERLPRPSTRTLLGLPCCSNTGQKHLLPRWGRGKQATWTATAPCQREEELQAARRYGPRRPLALPTMEWWPCRHRRT